MLQCGALESANKRQTGILGDRLARLSSGGRKWFHSRSNMTSALPAPEQADKVLRSPWRLENWIVF